MRILVVGLGSIGTRHVHNLREIFPDATIAVLRHGNCDKLHQAENKFDICMNSIDEALDFAPLFAIIASPAPFHLEIAMLLAKKKIHLMIEKPVSNALSGVADLINICEKQKVRLMTGYNLRFLPSLVKLHELLKDGEIGKILSVRSEVGQYLPTWRSGKDYRGSVSALKRLGGGVLLELSHEIDYLLWLFGRVEWVYATVLKQSDLEIDVEDTVHMILGFTAVDNNHQIIVSLTMDFVRHDVVRSCNIVGENGSLAWDGIVGTVSIYKKGESRWTLIQKDVQGVGETYLEEIKYFVACVESGENPFISGESGKAVLEIVDASVRSSAEGKKIYLEDHFKGGM